MPQASVALLTVPLELEEALPVRVVTRSYLSSHLLCAAEHASSPKNLTNLVLNEPGSWSCAAT
jgi:hypothetical protein